MAAITLDELLSELTHEDVLLNNLFQLDDGKFRCSVRKKGTLAFHFYDHPNPTAAVRGAILLATSSPGVRMKENKAKVLLQAKMSADDLLSELGL